MAHLQSSAPQGVELAFEGIAVEVDGSIASSLGILLNEFAANAFKHAFRNGGRCGRLQCILQWQEDGLLRLECRDDGGVSDTPGAGDGLGMRIAEAIAKQIDGRIEIAPGPAGMTAAVTFPAKG